ncbi:hypothetical protein NEMBOFW57_008117 [Staphylotrichum longicolle]|uniref:Uncharacterized protein n=1 Tax=Staphylotrichum longicolle TaxID=669026 RepID=A0AAD4EQS7_9PEZI|nr:hypothetical protein NEMBOFW57_008117 [Staphylotrichum longicolle]
MDATAGPEMQQPSESEQQRQQRQRRYVPAWRGIPEALYEKAYQEEQLSEEERRLLLSRGDVVGKALATPYELTTAEIHEALLWPPPDVARANVQRASDGTLRSPVDLYAKGKEAIGRGEFDTLVNDAEAALLARCFSAPDDDDFYYFAKHRRMDLPASGRAYRLIFYLLGLDLAVTTAAQRRMSQRKPPASPPPSLQVQQAPSTAGKDPSSEAVEGYQRQCEAIVAASAATRRPRYDDSWMGVTRPVPETDLKTSGPWPPFNPSLEIPTASAFQLFRDDSEPRGAGTPSESHEWYLLPEDLKAAYRSRAEALRREAWIKYKTSSAATSGPPAPGEGRFVGAFDHFRHKLAPDGGFEEALERWEVLTEAQRREWETRAHEARVHHRKVWELRDLGVEEREEALAPPPLGRKRYESVEAWKARREMERGTAAGSMPDSRPTQAGEGRIP